MKIKYYLITLLFCVITIASQAQPLQQDWAFGLHSTKTTYNFLQFNIVELDDNGNSYAAGSFKGTLDLDPSLPESKISSKHSGVLASESFVAKYNVAGVFQFGFAMDAVIHSIKVAANNEFYVVGSCDTIIDLDPSSSTYNFDGSTVGEDVFVAKYSASGSFISAKKYVGVKGIDYKKVELDSKNDLYIYGTFEDTVDFDPSVGVFNLISKSKGKDVFLAKYSDNNILQFAFNINTNSSSFIHNLVFDELGQVYITGNYFPKSGDLPLDLDPGSNNTNFAGFGGVDGFWAKYSSEGDYLAGHLYHGIVRYLRLDKNNNMYIIGTSTDNMDVDISSKEFLLNTNGGTANQYLVKYNANFDVIYGMTYRSTTNNMRFENMQVDKNENVYLCGNFRDTLGFVKGSNVGDVVAKGSRDAFFAKFNKDGQFKFAHSFGYAANEDATTISLDNKGNIWLTGKFADSIDTDTKGTATSLQKEGDGWSIFIAKYLDPLAVGVKNIKKGNISIYTKKENLVIDFSPLNNVASSHIKIIGINGQEYSSLTSLNRKLINIPLSSLPQKQVIVVVVNSESGRTYKKIFIP